NPGPWGMAQTGVPFGEVEAVRDWLGIEQPITKPKPEHPKRPIQGFACPRSEVSGRRLWGLFRERYGTPEAFFAEHFVANYCPLVFMTETGKNFTPDKLPAAEREPLDAACEKHLAGLLEIAAPEWAVGVGKYAEKCLKRVAENADIDGVRITTILHPSPASPAANRGWAEAATRQLVEAGVWRS
ncbi:MAG: uracil-DNA glycosylase family protein, partial [Planctomycetota bacterium]